jgi:hypothetical protein
MVSADDWRLQGQEKYLKKGEIWYYKNYADRITSTDHDHCEFCGTRFSVTVPDDLKFGYTSDHDYRWLCTECFEDFKEMFQFKVDNPSN